EIRFLELARPGSGDPGLAAGGANLRARAPVGNSPAPGEDEVAVGVELYDSMVAAVGHVHIAAREVNGDITGGVELARAGSGRADVVREVVAAERGERNIVPECSSRGVGGDNAVVVVRIDPERADFSTDALAAGG